MRPSRRYGAQATGSEAKRRLGAGGPRKAIASGGTHYIINAVGGA
jgi:hypothetical protein